MVDQALDHLRKRFHAFGRGTTEFLYPNNRRVLVFIRRLKDEDYSDGGKSVALRAVRGDRPLGV